MMRKESEEKEIFHTVDTGWAWMVVFSSFTCMFFVMGFSYSTAIYYVTFLETFGQTKGMTAWISSLNYGVLCAIGPVASLSINMVNCRFTTALGGLIASAGLLASAFATSIYILFFTFGVLTGAGFGMVFMATIVVISEYFVKYRVIASGISLAGAGLGTITYPWLSRWLVDQFTWRGALLITSAINLNVVALALLMRPNKISTYQMTVTEVKITPYDIDCDENELKERQHCDLHEISKKTTISQPIDIDYDNNVEEKKACTILLTTEKETVSPLKNSDCDYNYKEKRQFDLIPKSEEKARSLLLPKQIQRPKFEKSWSQTKFNALKSFGHEINLDLFRNFGYILLSINIFFYCFGLSVMITHISAYAATFNLGGSARSALISALGLSNLVGRIVLAAMANFLPINTMWLYILSYFVAGTGMGLCGVWVSFEGLMTGISVFGFFSAGYGPLLSEVTCVMVGVQKFSMAYGYLMIFMALGSLIGAPIAGILYDNTLQYHYSFYLGGLSLVISALVMVPERLVLLWKEKHRTPAFIVNSGKI